jgi:SAM-dependent methyltransferase
MNSSRIYLQEFASAAAASVGDGERVLDAGAGSAPYRPLFAHARYETADFERVPGKRYGETDHVCDLRAIPVEDGRYRLVLLTQVLEHVPEPGAVLRELRRVLAPGGALWASAPLFYEEHDVPYDYLRYTRFGLTRLLDEAGFGDIAIDWLEGYLGTLGYELDVAARAVGPRALGVPRRLLWAASGLAARADRRWKLTTGGHPKNWTVVATAV